METHIKTTTSYPVIGMTKTKMDNTKCNMIVEQLELPHTAVLLKWYSHFSKQFSSFLKS